MRRCERQHRPIAEICIIRMGFSSPPSLFGNICGGDILTLRAAAAFWCLPCGALGFSVAYCDGILIGWSLKCVRSLTSFSVRSIVAVIFSEFARSSSGNFSRFAHASSKFLGFVSASMCIILYISRRFFAASSDFLGLRSGFVCISRQFIDC